MDERDYKAMNRELNPPLQQCSVRRRIIVPFIDWLAKQNLMICEGVNGHHFRSSMIGGKKYTAEELYQLYESEYAA